MIKHSMIKHSMIKHCKNNKRFKPSRAFVVILILLLSFAAVGCTTTSTTNPTNPADTGINQPPTEPTGIVNTTEPATTKQKSEQTFHVDEWYPISQEKRSLEVPGVIKIKSMMVSYDVIHILIDQDSLRELYASNENTEVSFEFIIKTKNGEKYIAIMPYPLLRYYTTKTTSDEFPSFKLPGYWQPEVHVIYRTKLPIPTETPPPKATMYSR